MDSGGGVAGAVSLAASGHVSWRDYGLLKQNKCYIHNTLGMALMTFALGGLALWMPAFFHRVKGMTLQEANLWIGPLTVGAGLLGTMTGGWLADRLLQRTPGADFLVSGSGMLLATPCALVALLAAAPTVYLPTTFIAECSRFVN